MSRAATSGNGRPHQFIEYACGHSTPVRGTGVTRPVPCPDCAQHANCAQCLEREYTTPRHRYTGAGMFRLEQLLGPLPTKGNPNA